MNSNEKNNVQHRIFSPPQPFCYHWTSVEGWRVNCYLKSGENAAAERLAEATSGSVGVRCLPGATSLKSGGTPGSPAAGSSSSLQSRRRTPSVRPQIVVAPTNNRKDHCTYPNTNYQVGMCKLYKKT